MKELKILKIFGIFVLPIFNVCLPYLYRFTVKREIYICLTKGSLAGTPFTFSGVPHSCYVEALPLYSLANYATYAASPRRVMTLSQHRWLVLGPPLQSQETSAFMAQEPQLSTFQKKEASRTSDSALLA